MEIPISKRGSRTNFGLSGGDLQRIRDSQTFSDFSNLLRCPSEPSDGKDLLAWSQRKADSGSFSIGKPECLRTIPLPRSYFQKAGISSVHHAVEFQGVLTVTDCELFRRTFATGIGSAKAFGFGLLALAPM